MSTNEQELILTRGIPGSGKSTWARRWVMEDPENRVRVNRDDIREELYGKEYHGNQTPEKENRVTSYEHNRIKAALSNKKSVVSDNMHLNPRFTRDFYKMAKEAGVPIHNRDFPITLDEALRRNAARERVVPADVIRKIYSQNLGPNGEFHHFDGSYTPRPFVTPETREPAFGFDLDGTLSDTRSIVHFVQGKKRNFEMFHRSSFFTPPNHEVLKLALDAQAAGYKILGTTARNEAFREVTELWLNKNGLIVDALFMRKDGDSRPDYEVKSDMLRDQILPNYDLVHQVDDNVQAVRAFKDGGIYVTVVPGFDKPIPIDQIIKVDNVFSRGVCVRCGRSFKGEGTLGPNCKTKA